LIENLRGPAIKLGCTVVSGHTAELHIISSRTKSVLLYASAFYRKPMFEGASYVKPPTLPGNVTLCENDDAPPPVGMLVTFDKSAARYGEIEFVSGARIMGPVEFVKGYLKGRKFNIVTRWHDFICVEIV